VAIWFKMPVLFPEQLLGQVRMLLPLTMKLGEVGRGQHRRTVKCRSTGLYTNYDLGASPRAAS